MIKVKNINGNPETIPNTTNGIHNDGEYFYFFESEEERVEFLSSLPKSEVIEQPQIGAALAAVMTATPEELEQIKKLLGIN